MNKFFAVCLALLLPFTGFLAADWKALDDSVRGESDLDVRVLSATSDEVKVEITIPGYHVKKIMVGDTECLYIHVPGSSYLMEKGFPLLPKLAKLVKVPHDCKVTMEVISKVEVDEALEAPIVPSRGHFTRNIDPATVPYEFGPIYKQDVYWPAEEDQFQVGKNFSFRGACGLRLQVLPIRANHVQMNMKVIKKAVIAVKFEHSGIARMPRRSVAPGRTFNRMHREMFLNYTQDEPQRAYSSRAGVPNPDNKNLVVLTPTDYEGVIQEWVAWKKKCGYTVNVHSFAAGTTAGTLKGYLQGLYNKGQVGYVVLIGDASYTSNFENSQPTPTFKGKKEGAAADRVYVRLDGDDNYPDAFISRISGNNTTEIKNQLDKIVKYEQAPEKGEWFTKGICIASNQGSPSDKERAEWLQNGGGKTQKVPVADGGLTRYGYTHFDDIYDPYAYASDVTAGVNDGRSIICYIGHGSSTSWVSSGFNVNDVHNLNNGGRLPVIWSVACVNGQFVHKNECFGEAWLRKANGGAAGMECASTNESWVPPCDKQSETVNCIINKRYFTFGALEAAGCIKALEVWGDSNSSEGNKLAEQCHLFGDCTMLVRSKKPALATVDVSRGVDNTAVFQVMEEGRAPAQATVTVYSEDLSFCVSGDIDEQGNVSLSLDGCPKSPLFYTMVGSDLESVVDQPLE